jgi:hypothetical protein
MNEGITMEGIMTVADLIEELQGMTQDAPVFLAVLKYPGEFRIKWDEEGVGDWMNHSEYECSPLTPDEIIDHPSGIVYISAEVEEFNEERWMLNGNRAD